MIDLGKLKQCLKDRERIHTHGEFCYFWRDHRDCAIHALIRELEEERTSNLKFAEAAKLYVQAVKDLRTERDEARSEVERLRKWASRGWCSPGAQCGQKGCRRCD